MCVLSIKVRTRKKSGNSLNDPRNKSLCIRSFSQFLFVCPFYFKKIFWKFVLQRNGHKDVLALSLAFSNKI